MKQIHDMLRPPLDKIRSGAMNIEVSELWGGSRALFLFQLFRESGRPLLIVTANEEEASALADDLRFYADTLPDPTGTSSKPEILTFPAWGILPFEADSPDSNTVGERMRFLYNLTTSASGIYLAPVNALAQKLMPWELFADSVKTILAGQQVDPDRLSNALAASGYEHSPTVTRIGEFSRRGGIIDFFSPAHDNPIRLEFFGDTIDSLRTFDLETQRSLEAITQAVALPVRELIVTNAGIHKFEEKINVDADERGSTRIGEDEKNENAGLLEQLRQGSPPPGAEFLAPFFYTMEDLFHYLPGQALCALIEPDDIKKQADEWFEKIEQGRREEVEEGRTLPQTVELYHDHSGIMTGLSKLPLVNLRLLGADTQGLRMDTKSAAWLGVRLRSSHALGHGTSVPENAEGTVGGLAEKLKKLRERNRVLIVCGTDEAAERLTRILGEFTVPMARRTALDLESDGPWPVMVVTGRLSAGFAWQDLSLVMITDEEIFGSKVHRLRTARTKTAPFLSSFKELKPGDYVVHTDYGVGEYQGLSHISVDGFETDFLTLRYEPDAKLHVPLYTLDKVQKYIGAEGAQPKVDRLGAPTWARTKERVKKDILAMAQELVKIYAAREAMHRTPLGPPDNLYREFEAAFPFEETPDQQRAIEDVLEDMQKEKPMDRLVCGDVGFGKTEVALRAAFKAVEDGFQVAVIVPTTLLADQHSRTFSERLSAFSIRVEMMSRFRTKAEQKETLKGMKSGTVDIVIGTHRLLQRDVAFRNLGLLVIDEEHRFGVKHKERIKEFKKLVDVLTLTATPIPRTLHMSFAGIRDLSIIQTPPLDRQAIQVVLARFGKRVIREAVQLELGRGGQVFFVQNRVAGIERMAAYIQNLVPEAKIGVAHGQMKEGEIEEVMAKFVAGSLNVLVTTTIIESGIDIPNANTIIINRADRFGLAELYQIKGRVGRSRQKAYAYLLTPTEEALSDVARIRLRAIQELSELGAGFRIAAQDLETRGAGNLLGKQQSGHIAAVGIDLYTQMMEEAVAELRGEEIATEPDTQINLRASAFLPEDYIGDMSLRLAAYKEISAAGDEDGLLQIAEDLRDRYGPLPEPASNLLEIMGIRIIAKRSHVSRIDGSADAVTITFAGDAAVAPDKVMTMLKRNKGRIKLIPEHALQIALPDRTLRTASDAVKKCLQDLG
jgi:transcription-repair coupling factor (superfamily II helicase)